MTIHSPEDAQEEILFFKDLAEEGSQQWRQEHGRLGITRISRYCHWGHWPNRVAEKPKEI